MRTALTIAGSDSGGGAGMQADLKTFAAHGVFGLTAVTAVTAQDSQTVTRVMPMPVDLVVAQIDAVEADFGADATKIGMLATAAIAEAVASAVARHRLGHVVLDTVMAATGGAPLIDDAGVVVMRRALFPLADVVTANLPEAETLTGARVQTVEEMRTAARRLVESGARAALVKGGHLDGPPVDVLYDGHQFTEFHGERIAGTHTHGTGCTFASAIAAHLANGDSLIDAIRAAKIYVAGAIRHAPRLGHGRGPLGHFWRGEIPHR